MASNQQICPKCGTVRRANVINCHSCGYRFTRSQSSPSAVHETVSVYLQSLGKWFKIALGCGVIVLVGWLLYRGIGNIYRESEGGSPHPTDPAETTTKFFDNLQQQNFQECYNLLVVGRKVATVIYQQNRDNYFRQFDRIRVYLNDRAGKEFASTMEVSPNGSKVTFNNGIILDLKLEAYSGADKKSHYALGEFVEFPIDVAPGVGLEKHYRGVDRALESVDGLGVDEEVDDVAEIIRDRPDESKREREKRMMQAFKNARQLDTRHSVLEWIIREFVREKSTQQFLDDVAKNEKEVPQLRSLAQRALESTAAPGR